MKIDTKVARCLARLQTEEFGPYLDYLTAHRADAVKILTHAPNPVLLHQLQGQVQTLDRLLGDIADARQTLEKLER